MTKARVKPANWGFLEKLTSAQMNASDAYWPDVIDGAGGGAWSPAALIEIGGTFGIEVTAPSNLEGDVSIGDNVGSQLTIYADTFVNRDIAFMVGFTATFNGAAVFNDPATFNDTLNLAANQNLVVAAGTGTVDLFGGDVVITTTAFQVGIDALFTGNIDLSGTLDIGSGDIVLDSSSLTCTVPASFSDATNFTAGVTFTSAGSVSLASVMTASGVGHVRHRVVNVADANTTYGINDGDEFIIPALGAARTYTLSTTGAATGDVMWFNAIANTTTNAANFFGGVMALFNAATGILWLKVVYSGGAWNNAGYFQRP